MKRLIEKIVFSGLVTAWRLATCPTRRSPVLVKATTEGVSRPPSGFVMTTGSPPSMTATTELVVPRSMPMILLIEFLENSLRDDIDLSIKLECHAFNPAGYTDRASSPPRSEGGHASNPLVPPPLPMRLFGEHCCRTRPVASPGSPIIGAGSP